MFTFRTIASTVVIATLGMTTSPVAFSAEALNATDARFLQDAAQGGYFGVQASELAADRAEASGVKKFAALIIKDDQRIDRTLQRLAVKKEVTLPTQPNAEQQADIAKLKSLKGTAFDVAYLQHVGGRYQYERFESYKRTAERSIDVDVRGFARTVLTTLSSHYAMVNTLAKGVAPETVFPSHDTAPSR